MKDVKISKKKIIYPISEHLSKYLRTYQREEELPIKYEDLLNFRETFPILDKDGNDTLWEAPIYNDLEIERLHTGLKKIYALLKASGNVRIVEHKYIERIDYCGFGNTKPFRIKIVNRLNDVYDYFYIKRADASRVYGLEIEELLSPNQVNYIVNGSTLVEEHIAGIPGDVFCQSYLGNPNFNEKRIAKEFVKFNERCRITLLGDMRAYNFVIQITPDFDDFQFRIRAIDFDQQFFEGKLKVYMPQFFKENYPYVKNAFDCLTEKTYLQYQQEEWSSIVHRVKSEKYRLVQLRECAKKDVLTTPENLASLKREVAEYYKDPGYLKCQHMSEIIDRKIKNLIRTVKI